MRLKTLKTSLMIFVSLCVVGCASVPEMPRKLELWKGFSTHGEICRVSSDKRLDFLNHDAKLQKIVNSHIAQCANGETCISAYDDEFDRFFALTAEDLEMLYNYIADLRKAIRHHK